MITDYLRDQAFVVAWLALMASAWFGWAQEAPHPRLRLPLGIGSVVSLVVSIAFGLLVWRNWGGETALEGRYWVFGVIVALEAVVIGAGCLILARRGLQRWFGWWIALCVALHFLPLAWVFSDWAYLALTAVQVIGLIALLPLLRRGSHPTSRWACPWVGVTFLLYALVSGSLFLAEYGYPFG